MDRARLNLALVRFRQQQLGPFIVSPLDGGVSGQRGQFEPAASAQAEVKPHKPRSPDDGISQG
jgi:hypothetical protein